jgi:hypothetical protein
MDTNLVLKLGIFQTKPMMLYCNNMDAINITHNPVKHSQPKHIEIGALHKQKIGPGRNMYSFCELFNSIRRYLNYGLSRKSYI